MIICYVDNVVKRVRAAYRGNKHLNCGYTIGLYYIKGFFASITVIEAKKPLTILREFALINYML